MNNPSPLKLFLVVADDGNGENQDWFVVATDRDDALAQWDEHHAEIIDEYWDEPRIFEIPATPHQQTRGVLPWEPMMEP